MLVFRGDVMLSVLPSSLAIIMCGSRVITVCVCEGGGGGGGAGGPDPTEKSPKFRETILAQIPKKSQNYQASIQCWVIIGPPAKRHFG